MEAGGQFAQLRVGKFTSGRVPSERKAVVPISAPTTNSVQQNEIVRMKAMVHSSAYNLFAIVAQFLSNTQLREKVLKGN